MNRKVGIITSGDYLYAGKVCLNLYKDNDLELTLIDVKSPNPYFNLKSLKIFFLFGFFGTLKSIISFSIVKFCLQRNRAVKSIEKEMLYRYLDESNYDLLIMVNYPWRIDISKTGRVINFHPGMLPYFRGLMPICHTLRDKLDDNKEFVTYSMTMHAVDMEFDRGLLLGEERIVLSKDTSLYQVYDSVYSLVEVLLSKFRHEEFTEKKFDNVTGNYYSSFTWLETLSFKCKLLMLSKFNKFLINGGVIGIVSWCLQLFFYYSLCLVFPEANYTMLVSVYMAFIVAMIINFCTQRYFVFNKNGSFLLFLVISFTVISLVSFSSQYLEIYLVTKKMYFVVNFAYPMSALAISPLSFLLKKIFVFNKVRSVF